MLIASLLFSTVLVAIAYGLARSSGKFGGACAASAIGAVFGWPCIFFPALALCGFLMLLVGLTCRLTGRGVGFFLKGSLAALVGSHLAIGAFSLAEIREQIRLQEKYPAESLAGRLNYEKRSTAKPAVSSGDLPPNRIAIPPESSPERNLRVMEERMEVDVDWKSSLRNRNLRRLHQETLTDFINSPGFGVTRGVRSRTAFVELPDIAPIPFSSPEPRPEVPAPAGETPPAVLSTSPGEGAVPAPPADDLKAMHRDGVIDFVNAEGFGYVQDREHVIGFRAHQFRGMPRLPDSPVQNYRWRVARVELISLLKQDEPVAYRSDHLPRMDELRDAPTRPLNPFERQALADLRRGADIDVGTTPDRIRLLGSIRAVKHCLSCHEVERGELLGAFSYTLFRAPVRP